MRIAFLTNNRFPPREGIARHVLEVGRRLARRGHAVTVHGRAPGEQQVDGARLIGRPDLPLGPARQLADWLHLRAWLANGADGADIIHAHLPLLPPLPIDRPLYVTVHSPMLTDAAAIRERGVKARLLKLQASLLSRRYEAWYLDHATCLLAVSRGVRDELDAAYGVPPDRVAVIPNGVDLEFFAGSPPGPRGHDVLFVGRLGYRKGLFRLLDAFARPAIPRTARLLLAGEGPLASALATYARELGIGERVTFLGFLSREQLRDALFAAACVVNPADYESGPLTLLEAMAAGTPVVSTPTGLASELGPEPPLLLSEPEPEALASTIAASLKSPDAAADRARRARRHVERHFGWDHVVDRLEQAYGCRDRLTP
jgi:glycosyltransferase involved in cell wall biosynthesis